MCLQCDTDPINYGELLPGWALMKATKTSTFNEWKQDEYGLVRCNDPDFIFTCQPMENPYSGLSDEEVDLKLKEDEAISGSYFEFLDKASDLEASLKGNIQQSVELWEAATKAGFNGEMCIDEWLLDKMARLIAANPDGIQEEPTNE